MFSRPLSRRVFLKASGGALVGTLAFASGPIALLAPSRSWAVTTEQFTTHESEALLQFTRHVFPHRDLEDAVYALVVKDLDRQADADPAILALLRDGVTALDRQADGDWLALDATQRQSSVAEAAGSPFFEKIRSSAVVSLYSNPLAFAHFGYQGEEGDMGYLFKGFDDLTWLPAPPVADSGLMPGA